MKTEATATSTTSALMIANEYPGLGARLNDLNINRFPKRAKSPAKTMKIQALFGTTNGILTLNM